ncbi:MAG: rhamnogalacturonan acetylesterase [Tepidisphaeraceae bacterium]|jgi:lysophospholipase L1-like esterase
MRTNNPTIALMICIILALSAHCPAQMSATRPTTRTTYARDKFPYTPSNFRSAKPDLPSLIIAGDSTATNGDPLHRGWGALLIDYFDTDKINLVNLARGGRSARSFVYEGAWDQLLAGVKPGDYVLIQWGHNDGGNIKDPKFRADLPGDGPTTQPVTRTNGIEVVHTFGWYNRKFIADVRAKGAFPILMSPTQYNPYINGKFVRRPGDFADISLKVAQDENVPYLDHTNIINDRYEQLGPDVVRTFYVADHLHTTTPGATVNAECFIAGLKSLGIQPLVDALNAKGQAIPAYVPTTQKSE